MVACARQVVPGRARLFLLFRFISEESVELCGLVLAILQLVACPGFYPTTAFPAVSYKAACWLFFVTSVCSVLILTHSMLESRHFLVTHAGKHLMHLSHEQLEEVGQVHREVFESFLYLLSGITFAAGSILFLPGVYEHDERNDLTSGHTLSPRKP